MDNDIDDHPHKREILEHLVHTEERPEVKTGSKIRHDVKELNRRTNVSNIHYELGHPGQAIRDNKFMTNVNNDLDLRKLSVESPSPDRDERRRQEIALLKKSIEEGQEIKSYRDALRIHEESLATRILPPDKLVPCILHGKNRMGEKILQILLVEAL